MISNAWPYLNKENVEFPKIDQLPKYLSIVIDRTPLENSSGRKMVEDVILEFYNKAGLESTLSPLLKNVPYRFLSPWIPFTSNEEVIAKSNEKGARCPYSLQDDHITINPIWSDYLLKNYYEIISFIEKELLSFLDLPSIPRKEWDGKTEFDKGVAVVSLYGGYEAYAIASFNSLASVSG